MRLFCHPQAWIEAQASIGFNPDLSDESESVATETEVSGFSGLSLESDDDSLDRSVGDVSTDTPSTEDHTENRCKDLILKVSQVVALASPMHALRIS
jgi:hypothetical protein